MSTRKPVKMTVTWECGNVFELTWANTCTVVDYDCECCGRATHVEVECPNCKGVLEVG